MERAELLDEGRRSYADSRWLDAHSLLSEADREEPLSADDLELLATSAALVGRDDECVRALERAHLAHLQAREPARAAHGAIWIGLVLALGGAVGPASGWFGRAQRLVDGMDCVQHGYLLLPVMIHQEESGAYEGALATAVEATEIAGRFADADLLALALHEQGRVLAKLGRVDEGLARLDEAMVAVVSGELSPVVTWNRLLQRHRGLSRGLRARSGARVDGGAYALVRAAAAARQLHGALPRPSRGAAPARRCLAGGAG